MSGGVHERDVFVSHSAHDDEWHTRVRHAIVEAISELPGHRPLVDERDFAAGDLWRPLLYRWMAQADAGVLILTPAALSSPWVRKEATIMMWRRDLGSGVRIVPVLLGVTRRDIAACWPSIEIDESHAVRGGAEPGDDAEVRRIVDEVLSAFPGLGDADDLMRGWVSRVAGLVESAPEAYLKAGADRLGLQPYEWDLDGRCLTFGHALLHTDILRAERSLKVTMPGMSGRVDTLVELVAPLSVPSDVAEPLLRAMRRPPGERIVLVGARYPETGGLLTHRATCCDDEVHAVRQPGGAGEHAADAAFDELVALLEYDACVHEGQSLRPDHLDALGPIVLTLPHSPTTGLTEDTLRVLVARLRREFPSITLLVLSGDAPPGLATRIGVPDAVVAPSLEPEAEDAGFEATQRLRRRVGTGAQR